MTKSFTYQLDTLNNNAPKVLPNNFGESEEVQIERTQTAGVDTARQDTTGAKTDSVAQSKVLRQAQIRYREWQKEQKILISNSRYIKPIDKITLTTSVKASEKGISLPVNQVNHVNTDWLTVILVLALILFASVRSIYSKYLVTLFQSAVNYSTSFRMFQERNYTGFHGAYRLEIFFYIVFSVLIYQIVEYYQLELNFSNFRLYLICLAASIAYFFIKKLIYIVIGLIAEGSVEASEYLFNMDNYNRITGLILFPVVTLIAFNPFENQKFFVLAGIFIASVLYILMLQRGFVILLMKQFSIYYLFLYLCSLEFLPLLLIYKVVVV